jgi:hypothetical protein
MDIERAGNLQCWVLISEKRKYINMKLLSFGTIYLLSAILIFGSACQKTGTVPSVAGPAAITVVNAIPTSVSLVPVINTSFPINYFFNAQSIRYGYSFEYSPSGGYDTIYVVQQNSDTLNIGPKDAGLIFYGILNLKVGSIYSLFLTGSDTSASDFLLTTDSVPSYIAADSIVGIRFVNLSTGSNPISINLEGNQNGSVVAGLSYKGITPFNQYPNNSTTLDYLFVIRDAATGDSLTQFDFLQSGSSNNGYGLIDPNNGNLLTFKNVTIAIYGSEVNASNFPLATMLIDNY